VRYFWILFVGICAVFGAVIASNASAQQLTTEQFDTWTVNCQKGAANGRDLCEMVQTISQNSSGKSLAQLAIGRKDSNSPWIGIVLVPLGTDIPFGVVLVHENGLEEVATIIRCTNIGCRARWTPAADSIAAMKAGRSSQLVFRNIENKPVRIPVSLNGFSAALKRLSQ
jgi:invasion protein IalB